jgi:hypothetical protein
MAGYYQNSVISDSFLRTIKWHRGYLLREVRYIKYSKEERNKAFSLLVNTREILNDPSGLILWDPDFCERCSKFCDEIEKILQQEEIP